MVDSGQGLTSSAAIPEAQRWQAEQKADLIAHSLHEMGVDAMLPGTLDVSLGKAAFNGLVKKYALPFVATNLRGAHGDAPFPSTIIKEAGGLKVGIVGIVAPELGEQGYVVLDGQAALREAMAGLRPQVDVVLVLSGLGILETEKLVRDVPGVDFAVVSGSGRITTAPMSAGDTFILEAGKRGKSVGVLKLSPEEGATGWKNAGAGEESADRLARAQTRLRELEKRSEQARSDRETASYQRQIDFYRAEVERMQAEEAPAVSGRRSLFTNRIENLAQSIEDEPTVGALVVATKARIEGSTSQPAAADVATPLPFEGATGPALLAARDKAGAPSFGDFVGAQACMGCHAAEYAQWKGTGHARAWPSLEAESRSQDFQCFGCHVTGHGEPGGPTEPAGVAHLANVQCESCHGAGKAHVLAPTQVKLPAQVPEATCRTCHTTEMTGDRFNYQTYLPKVIHAAAH